MSCFNILYSLLRMFSGVVTFSVMFCQQRKAVTLSFLQLTRLGDVDCSGLLVYVLFVIFMLSFYRL